MTIFVRRVASTVKVEVVVDDDEPRANQVSLLPTCVLYR